MTKKIKKKESKKQTNKNQGRMINYPVGDFLIRVKNAVLARRREVEMPKTKLVSAVSEVLVKEGFLEGVSEKGDKLVVRLSFRKKEPVLLGIKLVSKPGLRIYEGVDELAAKRGPFMYIVSTPKGVMSSSSAIKQRLGGEVIAEIL